MFLPIDYLSLVLLFFLLAYMPINLYRYYLRLHVYPIKMWNAKLMLLTGITLFIHQIVMVVGMLTPRFTVIIATFTLIPADSWTVDAFVLQAFVLYIKFEIVHHQDIYADNQSKGAGELEILLSRSKWVISRPMNIAFMAFNLTILIIPVLIFEFLTEGVSTLPATSCNNISLHPECTIMTFLVLAKHLMSWSLGAFCAYKLKMVSDSIGIKKSLKNMSLTFVIMYVIFLVLTVLSGIISPEYNISNHILIVGYCIIFYFVIVMPVHQTYSLAVSHEVDDNQIRRFLSDSKRFDAFYAHAKTEFNVENLLFWRDIHSIVSHNRRKHSTSPSMGKHWSKMTAKLSNKNNGKSIDFANADLNEPEVFEVIYQRYICDGAPMQINLPDKILKSMRQYYESMRDTEGGCANMTAQMAIYKEALSSIEHLMSTDMLPRFKRTSVGKQFWADFEQMQQESTAMPSSTEHQSADSNMI